MIVIFKYIEKIFTKIILKIYKFRTFLYIFKKNPAENYFKNKKLNYKKIKNLNLVFIYRNRYKGNGSTVMRVFQLNKILETYDFRTISVNEDQISNIKDSICIINKSFLREASTKEFELLIAKGNILCFDYIDSIEKKFQIFYASVLIASSIKQFIYYKSKYPDKIIHLINHHVDPRINIHKQNNYELKIGYFGEKENGLYLDKLQDFLIPNYINTKENSNSNWISQLNKFNAHYIVRKTNNKKVFKPFLKGFTAAHCASNVIAYKFDGDSHLLLK